jgi:hypothetical protein
MECFTRETSHDRVVEENLVMDHRYQLKPKLTATISEPGSLDCDQIVP